MPIQCVLELYKEFLFPGFASAESWEEGSLLQAVRLADSHGIGMPVRHVAGKRAGASLDVVKKEYLIESLRLADEFGRLNAIFLAFHQRPIFFKGLVLSETIYAHPAFRAGRDIDFLIPFESRREIIKVLQGEGYVLSRPLSLPQMESEFYSQHAFEMIHVDRQVAVDVHWSILRPPYGLRLDTDCLFRSAVEKEILGHRILTPSDDYQLLLLVISSSRDNWQKFSFLGDLVLLLRETSASVEAGRELAQFHGILPIFEVTLELASILLEEDLRHGIPIAAKSRAIARRLAKSIHDQAGVSELSEFKLQLELRSAFKSKLNYALARLLLPHESDWNTKVPGKLFFLYYLMKPMKTLLRGAKSLFY